ncbi:helix-turn-helix domain-containing protein [Acidobacteria bacterium AH-259-O06]|nr:helix-turn-helix domain-containing protein [Acidobacteria bacterium AH-259-O06]
MSDQAELMDLKKAARFLDKTEKALRACVDRRTVPFRRIGSRIYFSKDELDEWWEQLEGVSVQEAVENLERANEG